MIIVRIVKPALYSTLHGKQIFNKKDPGYAKILGP